MTSIIVFDDLVAGLGTCPSDPDVAGTGVVLSFVISSLITTASSIYTAILDGKVLDEKAFLPKKWQYWLHEKIAERILSVLYDEEEIKAPETPPNPPATNPTHSAQPSPTAPETHAFRDLPSVSHVSSSDLGEQQTVSANRDGIHDFSGSEVASEGEESQPRRRTGVFRTVSRVDTEMRIGIESSPATVQSLSTGSAAQDELRPPSRRSTARRSDDIDGVE
ncbi:hypothetical protein MMC34_000252 [Xylographa carneopallida]|nr:hypothetical protein [Xylographa carneopallida]